MLSVGLLFWLILFSIPAVSQEQAKLVLHEPAEWQVFQRQSKTEGPAHIRFRLENCEPANAKVSWRLLNRDRTQVVRDWTELKLDSRIREYDFEVKFPSGGWFVFEIEARKGEELVVQQQVQHVGMGEIFVIAGQSNSANHAEEKMTPHSDLVVSRGIEKWQPAADPQPGASGGGGSFIPPLGDLLAEELKVPVGFVCCGVGATSVREWLPADIRFSNPPTLVGNVVQVGENDFRSSGSLFRNLCDRTRLTDVRDFRAVLWHQGESDANQALKDRTLAGADYQKLLTALIERHREALSFDSVWFVAIASYHTPDDPGSPDIRQAQIGVARNGIAKQGPDTDQLAGENRDAGGKGVHFSRLGQINHAKAWADILIPWIKEKK